MICGEKMCKLESKDIDYIFLTIFIYRSAKKPGEKRSKEDEQTLLELSLAHRCSQAKCQLPTNQLH